MTNYEKNELYERVAKMEEIIQQQDYKINCLLAACRIGKEDLESYYKLP